MDIFVINLEKNIERKNFILDKYNKVFKLNFIEAIYDKIPNKGCFLSHIKCINYAKENRMDYIIVMEDDCKNRDENFVKDLEDIILYLENNMDNWDVFLGGTTNVKMEDIIKKDIENDKNYYYIKKGNTTHFIIYNKKCYDYFLNYKFDNISIDKIWHDKLIGLTTSPFIFLQQPGFSDIELKYKNYNKSFFKTENILNNFK